MLDCWVTVAQAVEILPSVRVRSAESCITGVHVGTLVWCCAKRGTLAAVIWTNNLETMSELAYRYHGLIVPTTNN